MTIQYFAKVVGMKHVQVAAAHNEQEVEELQQDQYEPCSRTFYEAALRGETGIAPSGSRSQTTE